MTAAYKPVMKLDRLAGIAALVASTTACTGATPTQHTPPAPSSDPQTIATDGGAGVVADDPTAAVTPVEAPGEVVLHLRWKNPAATVATLSGFANLPASQSDGMFKQAIKELVRDGLRGKVDVAAFADLVSADAPVDLVLIADMSEGGQVPDPMFAISVGLTSVQRALGASKGTPRKIGDRVWEIGTGDKWGEPCAVAAAAGRAPARLVCGERKKHVEKVAAFVARNVAMQEDAPHDLRMKMSFRGLLDKYGRQWANQAQGLPVLMEEAKLGIPKFDQALMDAADAIAAEAGAMIYDADSVLLDVGLDGQKGAHLAVEMKFAGQKSWIVQTMLEGAAAVGPAPAIAWQVPATSEYVSWGSSGDPKRFDPILAALRAMLEGVMEKEKVGTPADRTAIAGLLRTVQKGKHVPAVMAAGHFQNAQNTQPSSVVDVINDAAGWYLLGFDEGPAEVKKWLEEVVKVYNRPSLQKLIKDELGPRDAKNMPVAKALGTPPGFGGGALAIELTIPNLEDPLASSGGAKSKTVDVKMHLLLMGDGSRTWIGFAGNKTELVKLMVGLKGGGSTLASRGDLSRMKSENHLGGAFTSLDGLVGMVKPVVYALMSTPGAPSGLGQDVLKIIEQMPHKGQTPLFMFADVTPGAQPAFRWSMEVPKETLEDLGFVIQSGVKAAISP